MKERIDHWRKLMPDHEVIEWNESNIDIGSHPYMALMHEQGKWAFASDLARLLVLREHGGIYLDTDVRMKKSLDPFLGEQCLWSFEFDHFISTAIIACVPGHELIHALLEDYDGLDEPLINNVIVTNHFIDNYPEFRLNNRDQVIGRDIRILPKEYFIVPSFSESKNFSVHLAINGWKPGKKPSSIGQVARAVIGDVLFFKLYNYQMGLRSDFQAKERKRRNKRVANKASP